VAKVGRGVPLAKIFKMPIDSDFYAVTAQVIPVLLLALLWKGGY
jgi:hypothetical protein